MKFGKKENKTVKKPYEVFGSGKKPRPQKGTGQARQGNKRASGRKGGGKSWGTRPKDHTINLPQQVKMKGLVSMLSAKLAEGKIIILNSDEVESHKT